METKERIKRVLAMILAFTLVMTNSSMNVLADTIIGGVLNGESRPAQEEGQEEQPEEDEESSLAGESLVEFHTDEHSSVHVDGEPVGNAGYAKNGRIEFQVLVEDGYEIADVTMNDSIPVSAAENGVYTIEEIQADSVRVEVTTQTAGLAALAEEVEPDAGDDGEEEVDPQTVYLYVKVGGNTDGLTLNKDGWYTVGKMQMSGIPIAHSQWNNQWHNDNRYTYGEKYEEKVISKLLSDLDYTPFATNERIITRDVVENTINWKGKDDAWGLCIDQAATDYTWGSEFTWHLDGYLQIDFKYLVKYFVEDPNGNHEYNGKKYSQYGTTEFRLFQQLSDTVVSAESEKITIPGYRYQGANPASITLNEDNQVLNLYYDSNRVDITGTKTWVDSGKRHDNEREVTLTLQRRIGSSNWEKVTGAQAVWSDANGDGQKETYTFTGVDKMDEAGNVYEYQVVETPVGGYVTDYDAGHRNITNTKTTGELTIEKIVKGSVNSDVHFEFEVSGFTQGQKAAIGETEYTADANGVIPVRVPANGSVTMTVPVTAEGSTYAVTETGFDNQERIEKGGHFYRLTGEKDVEKTVMPGGNEKASFTNVIADTKKVTVEKKWLDERDEFQLRPEDLTVTLTGNDGERTSYTISGTDWRKEEDSDIWTAEVEVELYDRANGNEIRYTLSESGNSGNVSVTSLYTQGGDVDFTPATDADGKATVTNTLKTGTLTVTKTVTGPQGTDLDQDSFVFTAADSGRNISETELPIKNGESVIFTLPAGTYTVTETEPDSPAWVHSYTTTTKVGEETGTGTPGMERSNVTVTAGANTVVAFTNAMVPKDVTIAEVNAALQAKKVLTGRALNAGEFTFEITDSTGALVATGTNAAAEAGAEAEVIFTYAAGRGLTYHTVGDYSYTVREAEGNLGGVTYSDASYTLTVSVRREAGGNLTAAFSVTDAENEPVEKALFENSYEPGTASTEIGGKKTLNAGGRTLEENEFTFLIEEGTYNEETQVFTAISGKSWTAQNGADGIFRKTIEYEGLPDVGEHFYRVTEQKPGTAGMTGTAENGMTYSTASYIVKVVVTDDGNGNLTAADPAVVGGEDVVFVNEYKASSTPLQIQARKTLSGRDLKAGEFEFRIAASSENP